MKNMKLSKKQIKIISIVGVVIILFALCIWFILQLFEYDSERNILLVKYDIRNQFAYTVYDDHVVLNRYWGDANEVHVPARLNDKPVTVIGEHCFSRNPYLKKVYLTENITEVERCGFYYCRNLEEMVDSENIIQVGELAFYDCWNLGTVNFHENVSCHEEAFDTSAFHAENIFDVEREEYLNRGREQRVARRREWEEKGILAYLDDTYTANEIEDLMPALYDFFRDDSALITGCDLEEFEDFEEFVSDTYWVDEIISRNTYLEPQERYFDWLFED